MAVISPLGRRVLESEPLLQALTSDPPRHLVASWLLHTELHCAAKRHPHVIAIEAITAALESVDLVDFPVVT
ncbi:hypothetical protein OG921_24530 [Aldersonia sp. NBC_00410]|uniref:hypothetical protein n=1 Tax=Aldersonia sp. NBC_00410 TaxID=2975954 RepID=UPI00224D6F5E|nr:hypothetical protein [Aldersonia sp. NBC_00410]MCX5046344.1 hypothetical protein [Aldersonia sp. NBC_00410]